MTYPPPPAIDILVFFSAEEELHGTNQKADEAEEEVDRLTKELITLDEELESTEQRLTSMQVNYHAMRKLFSPENKTLVLCMFLIFYFVSQEG